MRSASERYLAAREAPSFRVRWLLVLPVFFCVVGAVAGIWLHQRSIAMVESPSAPPGAPSPSSPSAPPEPPREPIASPSAPTTIPTPTKAKAKKPSLVFDITDDEALAREIRARMAAQLPRIKAVESLGGKADLDLFPKPSIFFLAMFNPRSLRYLLEHTDA